MHAVRRHQLRHPHLLQFKDSVEVDAADKGGGITLFLVTEPVQPLLTLLQELRLGDAQRCDAAACLVVCTPCRLTSWAHFLWRSDDYIAVGLSQVAQAVTFLNADCKMVRPLRA